MTKSYPQNISLTAERNMEYISTAYGPLKKHISLVFPISFAFIFW